MTELYINKIKDNLHDFGYGVELPVVEVTIFNKKHILLLGQEYNTSDEFKNNRNLYKNNKIFGVIKYKTNKIDLTNLNNLFNRNNKKNIKKKQLQYYIYLNL